MLSTDIKKLLKIEPFEPIRLALSGGRSVEIRHPDQVVVADRHLLVGLATVARSRPVATPRTGAAVARDWMIVNLLHITAIEAINGAPSRKSKKRRR